MEKENFPGRLGRERRVMGRRLAPDPFALGLLALAAGLLLFSDMRAVAFLAMACAVAYWLVMQAVSLRRR